MLGAAAFTALGLLVAGTVRPEATLAITNLLWILLGALGGIVIPAERLPALLQSIVQFLPSGALGQAMREAFLSGTRQPCPGTCPAALDGDRRRRSHPLVQMELRKL